MENSKIEALLKQYAILQEEHHRISKEQYQRSVGIVEIKRQIAHELRGGMYQTKSHRAYMKDGEVHIKRI